MAEPDRQVEVQLGHLCNNRCVFCASGQLSELDRAPQLPEGPIRRQMAQARADGARKITFLGGEPTIQRSFLALLQYAVALDFDEIVIFTNGVMTPRASFRDKALAVLEGLGPARVQRVVWRFSLQGGDAEAHDRTTCNPGAWQRIQDSMALLAEQGGRLSGNMCVVSHNLASVPTLAEVAARYGLENLHLDMFRPHDSGERERDYLRDLMMPYSQMAPAFRQLVARCDELLGVDYDVNIGNMPYCIAPDIAHKMHHGGEYTVTVAASGRGITQEGFDKYADRGCDKHKPPACQGCVFANRCGGVFDLYAEFHGDTEFGALSAEQLWEIDEPGHHFVLLAGDQIAQWASSSPSGRIVRVDDRVAEIEVEIDAVGGVWRLLLHRVGREPSARGWATLSGGRVQAQLLAPLPQGAGSVAALNAVVAQLDRAVMGSGELSGPDDLSEAWASAPPGRRSTVGSRLRSRAMALARGLQGVELGGMRQLATTQTSDGRWIELTFGRGESSLVLCIGLQALPGRRSARPPLKHRADGMDAAELAAFSRALGQHLKFRQRSAPTA